MIRYALAVACSAAIAFSSSVAAAQDFRFGQPFEGISIKAGFSFKFGETKRTEQGPQFRMAIEAGSEHNVGYGVGDEVYRSASLSGLQWDMGEQLRLNLGGLEAYRYDYGEVTAFPALNVDGEREGVSCYVLCIVIGVLLVGGIIWLATDDDDDDGNIRRRTSGNDRDEVIIEIN
ncbi:MAG: hypothetical protein ACE363_12015 [Alphaproteobacteria bacterium]